MQIATKSLKNAVRGEGSQVKVWENSGRLQKHLQESGAIGSFPTASPTSLELTLEDKKLENAVEPYLRKLEPVVQGKDDVIGCAVAVNGAIEIADVYASHALFVKVWPTLLRGGAVDALASALVDVRTLVTTQCLAPQGAYPVSVADSVGRALPVAAA